MTREPKESAEDPQQSDFDPVVDTEVAGDSSTYYQETVTMYHPDSENSATTVTREAYDEVWADKGWVIKEETEELPPPSQAKGRESGQPEA